MDISNLYNNYNTSTSGSALESQLKTDYTSATDTELMDACKEFEAYFLEQMFKEMMKTIPESEESSGYGSSMLDYYKDEMIQQVSADATNQNSLGLAQTLYEQMKRNYEL